MHDFIEKPSRLILFAVSIIALVTIIILLSRSRLINPGGESLISGHGKLTASVTPTPAAVSTQEGNAYDTVTEDYEEVYIEDDEPVYERDTWTEAEIDDQPATLRSRFRKKSLLKKTGVPAVRRTWRKATRKRQRRRKKPNSGMR